MPHGLLTLHRKLYVAKAFAREKISGVDFVVTHRLFFGRQTWSGHESAENAAYDVHASRLRQNGCAHACGTGN
jgi:hypothetical protein